MDTLAATIVVLASLLGVALTVLTLPGIWLAVGVAVICQLWRGELFSLWTLGAAVALGVMAELVEFFASAAGAGKAGGTRRGAIGAVVGGLVGAIAGTPLIPIPILGTIIGATVGAGLGAFIAERQGGRTLEECMKVGGGAAAGRLVATVIKVCFAVAIAVLLSVAAFW